MSSVFVVVAQVAREIAAQASLLEDEEAGEDGLQAFVEDRALDPLEVAVNLRLVGVVCNSAQA